MCGLSGDQLSKANMQYLKFTYVDAVTGISISAQPAVNGPKFPEVAGLEFDWARESAYPTPIPEFFGTCPDGSDTQADGVLEVMPEHEWVAAKDYEMQIRLEARSAVVRQERNGLLTSSDWTQVADAPVDAAAWVAYRQALRDLTSQPGFPWAVEWPEVPQ